MISDLQKPWAVSRVKYALLGIFIKAQTFATSIQANCLHLARAAARSACWAGICLLILPLCSGTAFSAPSAGAVQTNDWPSILSRARGQTVYWNAWGGDALMNNYVSWAAVEMKQRFGVVVRHVKLGDTAEAVTRVLAEKAAGRDHGGSVDVIWINGENFAAMKKSGLLYGPFTQLLPNSRLVDTVNKPTLTDFTVPVEGMEAPWSMGRFVFLYDQGRLPQPPRTPAALLAWCKAHPGRFTYPQPPDFMGTTFLKQLLLSLSAQRDPFYAPVVEEDFKTVTSRLWAYLDELHPAMWRQARVLPANGPAQTRLLADGEVDIALSFDAEAATTGILTGQLPDTTRTFVFEGGTIGNASFMAIPYNSSAREGALALIDFLLSPEAQARKQDPRQLGSPTVLALEKLSAAERASFSQISNRPATLSEAELGQALAEPHPSWVERIEKEWRQRYGNAH